MEKKFVKGQKVAVFHNGWETAKIIGTVGTQVKGEPEPILVEIEGVGMVQVLPCQCREEVKVKYADHSAGVYKTQSLPR